MPTDFVTPYPRLLCDHVPDYVMENLRDGTWNIADPMDFHLPTGDEAKNFPVETLDTQRYFSYSVSLSHCDNDTLYHMLIRWCMVQSFWHYVVGRQQVSNAEFDYIKGVLKWMKTEYYYEITEGQRTLQCPNGFDPNQLSGNVCLWHEDRYPHFLVDFFRRFNKHPQHPGILAFMADYRRAELYKQKFFADKGPPPKFVRRSIVSQTESSSNLNPEKPP